METQLATTHGKGPGYIWTNYILSCDHRHRHGHFGGSKFKVSLKHARQPKVQFRELGAPSSRYTPTWGIAHFAPLCALVRAFVEVHETPSWPLSRLTSLWSTSHAAGLNLERGQHDWRGRETQTWRRAQRTNTKPHRHARIQASEVSLATESDDAHETPWCHMAPAVFCFYNPLKIAAENQILHPQIIWEVLKWTDVLLCAVIKAAPKWVMDQAGSVGCSLLFLLPNLTELTGLSKFSWLSNKQSINQRLMAKFNLSTTFHA